MKKKNETHEWIKKIALPWIFSPVLFLLLLFLFILPSFRNFHFTLLDTK